MKKAVVPALLVLQFLVSAGVLGFLVLRKPAQAEARPAAAAASAAPDPHAAKPPTEAGPGEPRPTTARPGGGSGGLPHAPAAELPPGGAPHGQGDAKGAGAAEGHGPSAEAEGPSGEQALAHLMEGNRRFVAGEHLVRPISTRRAALVTGQHPGAIVLACSDSRVPPELVFDLSLGEIFVVRTAGNVADQLALGSIEYAAEHLHAKLLIVLGHERCGAVTAATQDGDPESPNLKTLVAAISPAVKPLKLKAQGAELIHLGVEANVEASVKHVLEGSLLLRDLVAKRELTVKRAIYDLESGTVRTW